MEAGGKDCEEETLQTAFKKLRVDAESLPGAVSAATEALAPRAATAARGGLDAGSGAKPKLCPPKDIWHGCMRKTSRGASRTQRRRRSKSPILHPPKFTYCSAAAVAVAAALSTPSGGLKHQRLTEPPEPRPPAGADRAAGGGATAGPAATQKEIPASGAAGHISPLVFGSRGQESRTEAADKVQPAEESVPETSAGARAESPAAPLSPRIPGDATADFRALSESPRVPCSSCAWKSAPGSREETGPPAAAGSPCRCRALLPRGWQGVEVYSFTGLRNSLSECESSPPAREETLRTPGTNSGATAAAASSSSSSSSSPRSCSEQARAYVDDITIEDLSGYMEYYLYIPKKMSHMAEMMYT
ncbi:oxidative stress-responsive serine-rich protein 1 [Clinocottus analis]|uniref:oxidative stress-responsive serine-rich protein 1 n=1 Tax=Clinocottus analis TaxID=304258 RepID=UPI0035BEC47C